MKIVLIFLFSMKLMATTSAPVLVNGLTDAQLRASPVPVSASIDTTGLATEAKQTAGNSTLSSLLSALQLKANLTETQPVSLATVPTHGVTGTFWQATQPVSGPLTDAQLRNTAIPVSIASMPSTPVTGAFYQATQPVSLASAPTTPVTGTFWQATQPVSIASVPSHVVTGPLTDTELRASAVPISAASLPLPTLAATSTIQTNGTQKSIVLGASGNMINEGTSLAGSHTLLTSLAGQSMFADSGSASSVSTLFTYTLTIPMIHIQLTFSTSDSTVIFERSYDNSVWIPTSVEDTDSFSTVPYTGYVGTSGNAYASTYKVLGPYFRCRITASTGGTVAYKISMLSGYSSGISRAVVLGAGSAVIGHVTVDSAPTTAVTGTFFQATQPVSGTFWQATQPVSGTFYQATQPVSIATAPVLVAGSAIVGKVGIDQTTPGTTNGVQVNAALPAGSNVIGHVIADTGSTTAVTGTVTANATLSAETTKVIGTVNLSAAQTLANVTTLGTVTNVVHVDDNSGSLTVDNSNLDAALSTLAKSSEMTTQTAAINTLLKPANTLAAVTTLGTITNALPTGSNVIGHIIADTGSTTAVTGNVTVTQGTSTNLKADVTIAAAQTLATVTTVGAVTAITNALPAGTNGIGKLTANSGVTIGAVEMAAAQTLGTVSTVTNLSQQGGVAISLNSGAVDTGTQRVVLASAVGNPCANPASTLVSITGATAGTTAAQIVALSGTTKIYICSMTIIGVSGTAPTFSLVQGTGSNCATGQTVVKQSWATTAGTLYAFANPVAVGAAGAALCYLDAGTLPIQNYQITYVQI